MAKESLLNEPTWFEKQTHEPSPYRDFEHDADTHMPSKNLVMNISEIIGNEGVKILYPNNGCKSSDLFVRWNYRKQSGEHKKNNGSIYYYNIGKIKINGNYIENEKELAYIPVKNGNTEKLIIARRNFAHIIEKHPDATFYQEIMKLFYRPHPDEKKVARPIVLD